MHLPQPAAYCIQCRFRREVCLCDQTRKVDLDLRLLVILHAFESRKMSNTGHLAHLVVPDCRIAVHGWRDQPVDLAELEETHAPDGREWRTILFFPGLGAKPLTEDYLQELRKPAADGSKVRLRLVVPDGTWSQARRMVKRVPILANLPRVILPAFEISSTRDELRPRGNPDEARVSTCEAMALALGMLGEPEAEKALFEAYDAAALRIALMRGKRAIRDHRDVLRSYDDDFVGRNQG